MRAWQQGTDAQPLAPAAALVQAHAALYCSSHCAPDGLQLEGDQAQCPRIVEVEHLQGDRQGLDTKGGMHLAPNRQTTRDPGGERAKTGRIPMLHLHRVINAADYTAAARRKAFMLLLPETPSFEHQRGPLRNAIDGQTSN